VGRRRRSGSPYPQFPFNPNEREYNPCVLFRASPRRTTKRYAHSMYPARVLFFKRRDHLARSGGQRLCRRRSAGLLPARATWAGSFRAARKPERPFGGRSRDSRSRTRRRGTVVDGLPFRAFAHGRGTAGARSAAPKKGLAFAPAYLMVASLRPSWNAHAFSQFRFEARHE
jgi:hypothetical protein